jgi:hypothetical protein
MAANRRPMAEVEATRFVAARPARVERVLGPETILAAEGTFDVAHVEEAGEGRWRVTGSGRGMSVPFAFAELDEGYRYEALGDHGPFREFEATLTYGAEDHGTRLEARSTVRINLPLQVLSDRLAGWKRRSELERLLDGLAADLE